MGNLGQHHRMAHRILLHEQVAAELCLPDQFEYLDFHSFRSGSIAIALLTVSFQTIKAATANPVDALKYE
jgi:hypothetical protein